MLIVIDAGHGGHDLGAVGPTGLQEKDVALNIALKVGELLEAGGIDVIYTRDTDVFIPLDERADIANQNEADYFISIHINSATNSSLNGIETYIYPGDKKARRLAWQVQKSLLRATQLTNRGVKTADFVVLRETDMPAILVEVAFISNPEEGCLLSQESFLEEVAKAIADGVFNFLERLDKRTVQELIDQPKMLDRDNTQIAVIGTSYISAVLKLIKKLQKK